MLKFLYPFALAGLDLFCKESVESQFDAQDRIRTARDIFLIRKVHNKGFSEGRMANDPEKVKKISTYGTVFLGVAWLLSLQKKKPSLTRLGLGMAFAGAISNTVDRYRHGYVIDYIQNNKGPEKLKRFIFNLADVMLIVGGGIVTIRNFLKGAIR